MASIDQVDTPITEKEVDEVETTPKVSDEKNNDAEEKTVKNGSECKDGAVTENGSNVDEEKKEAECTDDKEAKNGEEESTEVPTEAVKRKLAVSDKGAADETSADDVTTPEKKSKLDESSEETQKSATKVAA